MFLVARFVRRIGLKYPSRRVSVSSRLADVMGRKSHEKPSKMEAYCYNQRTEQNPEYHHAPRCYVKNYIKHQFELSDVEGQERQAKRSIRLLNPRYRWADFRRRMIYGIYDI